MLERERPRTNPADGRPGETAVGGTDAPGDAEPDIELQDDSPRPRRFPRLALDPPDRPRRLASHRLLPTAAIASVAVVVLTLVCTEGLRRVTAYVSALPDYQLDYRDIVLDPPPPAWFHGGSHGFLDHVWANTTEPTTFSALAVDRRKLIRLFQWNPWARRVRDVRVDSPNRLTVRLEYRVPVALAEWPDGNLAAVDGEGVLLPLEDFDREAAGPLVGLNGFPPPVDRRSGEPWNTLDSRTAVAHRDELVAEAAQLAAFVKPRLRELSDRLPERPSANIVLFDKQFLYVQLTSGKAYDLNSLMIFWEHDWQADPSVRGLDHEKKWGLVRSWLESSFQGFNGDPILLCFKKQGLVVDTRYPGRPPRRTNDRRRDAPTRR